MERPWAGHVHTSGYQLISDRQLTDKEAGTYATFHLEATCSHSFVIITWWAAPNTLKQHFIPTLWLPTSALAVLCHIGYIALSYSETLATSHIVGLTETGSHSWRTVTDECGCWICGSSDHGYIGFMLKPYNGSRLEVGSEALLYT